MSSSGIDRKEGMNELLTPMDYLAHIYYGDNFSSEIMKEKLKANTPVHFSTALSYYVNREKV